MHHSDSVRTEYIERVRIDTVLVKIPLPVESSRQIVQDSTSHLETTLALSDAWINRDGSLGHSIKNKDSPIEVSVPIQSKDTQISKENKQIVEIPMPYSVEVYKDKPLSTWQKIQINGFWVLLACLFVALIYIFRKPLLRLMCRLKL
ncbi:MAG: hypothetical protein ACI4AK_09395 [Lepagella sp.]